MRGAFAIPPLISALGRRRLGTTAAGVEPTRTMTITSKDTSNVLVEIDGAIAYLTLNRPEKRNALSRETMRELLAGVRRVGKTSDVRVVILRARGPVFSAGHDLSEMVDCKPDEYES